MSMRRLLSLLLGLALSMPARAEEKPPPRLRVLSYNIHHGEGVDRKLDLERIAKVIRSARPDLVALQEVDRKVERTKGIDQPAELAKLTEMHVVFGANIKLQGGEYGNAILSRHPIARHKNHLLPRTDNGEQRGVLEAEIKLPSGQRVLFLATHLDHRRKEAERIASAKVINELAEKRKDVPMLLAGDLNATPSSHPLKELGKVWKRTNDKPLSTIPVGKPTRQIDYAHYRAGDPWKVVETRVLDEPVASDHRPILAVLEFVPVSKP